MYFSYHQDDWNTWLPLAEFAYNDSDHSSTKQSPFFTVYGRDPQFDSAHITQDTSAGKLSTKIQSVQQDFKRELEVAINWFKRYADKSRESPPVFNPGDMVWLSSKNIKSTIPTKNLSERWLGPFPILKKVSTHSYHLKLPSQWKSIHPVFHISLFEPVKTSTIPNRHQEPPPPIIIEEEEEWEVSQILDSKLKRRKSYGIWWNRKVSVKTEKDPHGNQLKTSIIVLNLSKIFILCILTSQDPILQKLEFLWCLVGRGITKIGANWPHHIFIANLAPSGALCPFGHNTIPWPIMASGHILPSLASLANSHILNPQASIFVLGLGGLSAPYGIYGPWANYARPFWPNPMSPKGGSTSAPKARWVPNHNWAHLSQFRPQIQNGHKDPQDPILANNHCGPLFSPWPLVATRSAQLKGNSFTPPCTPYSRLQEWCIDGIIYHYAPFLLSNSMVTISGPNSIFPNQGPKIQRPFQRRTFQLISLAIHGGNQKTIQGCQSPGPTGVGLAVHSGLFQVPFSEVRHYSNQLSLHQVFQYSLDNSIGPYRWQ
ncbi:hypothetical protein O181_005409 [Austropuccinia psidii MF-1]|uniref:Tf2-1-like SH3-like domain-containing protein n=1 Tax=Austropuccinia psidii MF-1 TaxID=1389203 RepID=A0A9Q3BI24_9BASI|nr:hypothetical protein [Austropuccinia psidii MF-1]